MLLLGDDKAVQVPAKAVQKGRTSWGTVSGHFVPLSALLAVVLPFDVSHHPGEKASLAWLNPVQLSKELL